MSAEIFGTCISVETEHHQEMSIIVAWNPSARPSNTSRCRSPSHGTRAAPTYVRPTALAPKTRRTVPKQRLLAPKKGTSRLCSTEIGRALVGPKPSVERRAAHILCSPSDTYEWLDLSQLQRQVVLLDFRGSCSTKTGSLHFP